MGAGHSHISRGDGSLGGARRSLILTMGLTGAVMLVEVAGGLAAGSLALLSDAGHMFADLLALGMALFAVTMAARPAPARRTYGYHRVEILAALANGLVLALIAFSIVFEAVRRFESPGAIDGGLVLAVAAVGLAANLAGMWFLSRHTHSINVRSARLHILGDALSSAGVLAGGLAIFFTSWYRLDAVISLGIALVILVGAYRVLRETVDILLEATPKGLEPGDVSAAIEQVPGVKGVHDLHIWCITSGMTALSGHVILDGRALARSDEALNTIKELLQRRFGIDHTTIQIESESYSEVGEIH